MNKHSPREIPLKVLPPELRCAQAEQGTDAYPLASGPGLWLERFGSDYLLSYLPGLQPEANVSSIRHRLAKAGLPCQRLFTRCLVAKAPEQCAPRAAYLAAGTQGKSPGEAQELGRRYGIDFNAYTVGLFLDQAQNRQQVADHIQAGQRLLNLFAYTCSFSVVAATGGAETVSVDLSKPALQRGRANFELNDLELQAEESQVPGHRFLVDDAFAVLPRLDKRQERFDWIILDPPTFSRGKRGSKKKVFRVERDLPELITLCWSLLNPAGQLLVSTNCTALDPAALRGLIHHTLAPLSDKGGFTLRSAPTTSGISAPGPSTAWWVQRVA